MTYKEIVKGKEAAIDTVQDEELKAALRERVLQGRGRPKRGRKKDSKKGNVFNK